MQKLIELGAYYDITFFSFADYADQECCRYLSSHNLKVNQWNPDQMTIDSYLSELQRYDLFVTARYHGAVVASLMKKPFITIGIEPKLEMIADLFDMPCWQTPYDVSECIDYVKIIESQYMQIQQRLEMIGKQESDKALKMVESINIQILKA